MLHSLTDLTSQKQHFCKVQGLCNCKTCCSRHLPKRNKPRDISCTHTTLLARHGVMVRWWQGQHMLPQSIKLLCKHWRLFTITCSCIYAMEPIPQPIFHSP